MTRDIDAATESASQADTMHPVLFVALAFDSGTVRFHSEIGDITWGGNTYTGTGRLGGITAVQEDAELTRTPLTLSLSGLPTDLYALLLAEHYQGRPCTVYLGYLDLTTYQLVADPIILYRGRMDRPEVVQEQTLTIALSVESRFAAWDRPQTSRYNNADQQARYPGDRGLEFVEQSAEKQIAWGTKL